MTPDFEEWAGRILAEAMTFDWTMQKQKEVLANHLEQAYTQGIYKNKFKVLYASELNKKGDSEWP